MTTERALGSVEGGGAAGVDASGPPTTRQPAAGGAAILARLRAERDAKTSAEAAALPVAEAASEITKPACAAAAAVASPAKPALPAAAPGPRPAVGGAAILARLRAQREAKAVPKPEAPKKRQVLVLYASQTGTAQEIARTIAADAEAKRLPSKVASLNEHGLEALMAEAKSPSPPLMVIVASSTGDGDPPDNAAKFYTAIRRKSHAPDALAGLSYSVLGLGDSNYTRFCAVPRALAKRLRDLGGREFYPCKDADEVDGLEPIIDAWTEGLWPVLQREVDPKAADVAGAPSQAGAPTPGTDAHPPPRCRVRLVWGSAAAMEADGKAQSTEAAEAAEYSAELPFLAPVTAARWLTTPASGDRKVLHLEIGLEGSGIKYSPGDSLGVLPQNEPALVDGLLRRLGADGSAVILEVLPVEADASGGGNGKPDGAASAPSAAAAPGEALLPHLRTPCTLRSAFTAGLDLTSPPRKSLLRLLAAHAHDPTEAAALLRLAGAEGRQEYGSRFVEGRPSLLQLLEDFPSVRPPLDALLDALPPLAARMYSVSSSPLESPDRAQIAFTIVRFRSAAYGDHAGVATTWLERLAAPAADACSEGDAARSAALLDAVPRVPVFLRRGGCFALPAHLSAPLLMIGPGTGVTPFRGFLQQRRAALAAAGTAGAADAGDKERGPAWLYFGCRHPDQDYLYRSELETFATDGTLDALHAAFSRVTLREPGPPVTYASLGPGAAGLPGLGSSSTDEHRGGSGAGGEAGQGQRLLREGGKLYVQDLMAAHSATLYRLFLSQPNAYIFVCGDGAAMARDVHACLLAILQREGGMEPAAAAAALADATRAGRYVRDIWS